MSSIEAPKSTLDIVALGWGLSSALVAVYVLCLLALSLMFGMPMTHGGSGIFSNMPAGAGMGIGIGHGIIGGFVVGWIVAVVLGSVYNRVVARR